jgi:hypothetical protein
MRDTNDEWIPCININGSSARRVRQTAVMTLSGRTFPTTLQLLLFAILTVGPWLRGVDAAETPTEYQVEAAFVFNFSHFVEWPPQTFTTPTEPFVIGVLGSDPFGAQLDEAVRGEQFNGHPLVVHRFRNLAEIDPCQILFIDHSESSRLGPILAALNGRNTLTVSQADEAAEHGIMIQFATEDNRIRLRINVESARAAGLTISSKLLRPAAIVGTRVKG